VPDRPPAVLTDQIRLAGQVGVWFGHRISRVGSARAASHGRRTIRIETQASRVDSVSGHLTPAERDHSFQDEWMGLS
jgi:hypothetical protein